MKDLLKLLILALGPLLGLLSGGCTVYNRAMHPYRLPTPRMTPELQAKARAAEKLRHRGGTTLKAAEPAADAADGGEPAPDAAAASPAPARVEEKPKTLSYSELPAGTRAKYDKHLLLKDPKPRPRPLHRYSTGRLPAREASREVRRLRHYVRLSPREHPTPAPRSRPAPLNTLKARTFAAPRKAAPKTTRPAPPPVRAPQPAKPKTPPKAAPAGRARSEARVSPKNARPAPVTRGLAPLKAAQPLPPQPASERTPPAPPRALPAPKSP